MSSSEFGRDSTTDEVLDGIDLRGKRAVVTGASGGLGAETARALASKGARVTLTARDLEKAGTVAAAICATYGSDAAAVAELELADQQSVRAFAKDYLRQGDGLDLLINNAGIMACPLTRTAQGLELQFATNHLGHFLLTCLLAPALQAAAASRVVMVSSAGHMAGPMDFDDPQFEVREYEKFVAYGQSKTANALFALELDRRLHDRGVFAYSLHPGVIMTELARNLTPDDIREMMAKAEGGTGMHFKSVEAGAATSVWAATAPQLASHGGAYLEDCRVAGEMGAWEGALGCAPHARDVKAASRLWTLSEELVGEEFDL
ncbi:MAG: SDR family NAD(P)-dependent oxidoreductase [bacterium]|nr:SDR family NAD(P)-dependent oxidoreductase [bacterium]